MAGGYQQMAQAEMMLGAAEGMKKGGTGAGLEGMGMGMGFGMANQMAQMMGQQQMGARPGGGAAPAPAPAESRDQIMKTLKELGELKSAGILTDAEFDAKKKELLAKL